ncbi:MAG: FAD binding domain-containing protein [Proteobacteria bacterium]|nr:FAD binding domain-containing protein [Pseudomonadota bacterium]
MRADYHRPPSLTDALDLLARPGPPARVIAGGTDLMVERRAAKARGEASKITLVDLADLPELSGVREDDGDLIIGAAVTFSQCQSDPLVNKYIPLLAEAARTVGSVQIRNVGTLGGNVANQSPAADGLAALVALGAVARVASASGERQLPVGDVGDESKNGNLAPDEVIVSFRVQKPPCPAGNTFLKVIRRQAGGIARFSVSVQLAPAPDGRTIRSVALGLGAVFGRPRRLASIEKWLLDQPVEAGVFIEAGRRATDEMLAVSGARPSMVYKEPALGRTVTKGLATAWQRAGGAWGVDR